VGAKPLLLYYSFLNLAKAYVLSRALVLDLDRARHGIAEFISPGGTELLDASLPVWPTVANNISVFDMFYKAVSGAGLPAATSYKLPDLLPQIVPGHRLWCAATKEHERFVSVHSVSALEDRVGRLLWLNVDFAADDLSRLHLSTAEFLTRSRLTGHWREVAIEQTPHLPRLRRFEQVTPMPLVRRPSEHLDALVNQLSPLTWANVLSVPPYRRYYVHASAGNAAPVLPQLLSMYAVIFYLGSVTRYRPHHFTRILDGPFGPQIYELITTIPAQFLYLMASRFAQQEITRAATI
jgi:hypothetical protein